MTTPTQIDDVPRRWWLGSGPIAFVVLTLLACGIVVYHNMAAAPADVRQREQQSLRGSSFCDVPSKPPGRPIGEPANGSIDNAPALPTPGRPPAPKS